MGDTSVCFIVTFIKNSLERERKARGTVIVNLRLKMGPARGQLTSVP